MGCTRTDDYSTSITACNIYNLHGFRDGCYLQRRRAKRDMLRTQPSRLAACFLHSRCRPFTGVVKKAQRAIQWPASLAANVPQGSGDGKQPSVSQACRNTGGEVCPLILDFCSLPPTLLLPDTQCWGLRWFCYPVLARTYRFRSLT